MVGIFQAKTLCLCVTLLDLRHGATHQEKSSGENEKGFTCKEKVTLPRHIRVPHSTQSLCAEAQEFGLQDLSPLALAQQRFPLF